MVQSSPLTADGAAQHVPSVRPMLERGRLGVYSVLGAVGAAVPLPWVPEALARRVRGALVHDVASHHGLSLTPEARHVLSEPTEPDVPRSAVSQALKFFGIRLSVRILGRVGPIAMLWPLHGGLRTYVLGHVFDRYLRRWRRESVIRIDVREARLVRRAADGALLRAVTARAAAAADPPCIDDQRDPVTSLVDTLLGSAAGVPDQLLRRLDVAFDELLARPDA